MKSKWMVTSNIIGGKKMYGVYRRLNINKVDHSGNREHYGELTPDEDAAVELAERLNKGEEGEETVGEKKVCPRCGEPMEEFAVAWGWECCYDCSVKDGQVRLKRIIKYVHKEKEGQ